MDYNSVAEILSVNLKNRLFGDESYLSKKLSKSLQARGLQLITNLKKNMKKYSISPVREYLLNKRKIGVELAGLMVLYKF